MQVADGFMPMLDELQSVGRTFGENVGIVGNQGLITEKILISHRNLSEGLKDRNNPNFLLQKQSLTCWPFPILFLASYFILI